MPSVEAHRLPVLPAGAPPVDPRPPRGRRPAARLHSRGKIVSPRSRLVLGWTHGFGWILLCLLVARGCVRGLFPWPLLAATVSPLGPIGSTLGFEYLSRRRVA